MLITLKALKQIGPTLNFDVYRVAVWYSYIGMGCRRRRRCHCRCRELECTKKCLSAVQSQHCILYSCQHVRTLTNQTPYSQLVIGCALPVLFALVLA